MQKQNTNIKCSSSISFVLEGVVTKNIDATQTEVPRPTASTPTGGFSEMENFRLYPRPTGSESAF